MRRVLLLLAIIAAAPQAASAQTLRGRVIDEATGALLRQVHVSVLHEHRDSVLATVLAADGRFLFEMRDGAEYRLRAEALGYTTLLSAAVRADRGQMVDVDLRLRADAIALEPLTVTARQTEPHFMRDLRRRQQAGWGRFLMREDLEERTGARLLDVLASVQGLSVSQVTDSAGALLPLFTARTTGAMRECYTGVYVNGFRQFPMRTTEESEYRMHEVLALNLWEIEAIEVYRGVAELPAEYSDPGARCGAIGIWLRSSYDQWARRLRGEADYTMRVQLGAGPVSFSGRYAPATATGSEVALVWDISHRWSLGFNIRSGTSDMTPEAARHLSIALNANELQPITRPHPLRIASIAAEPRVSLLTRGSVRPVASMRLGFAERRHSVANVRRMFDQPFAAFGWVAGVGAGVEVRPARRVAIEGGVLTERVVFGGDAAPAGVAWTATAARLRISYAPSLGARLR